MIPPWLQWLLAGGGAAGLYLARGGDLPGALCLAAIVVVVADAVYSLAIALAARGGRP